ncbi:MAG: oligosaccharide flippase family protein [Brevefilum sp.]|nr:oligosaccharide flippase family protein [Brevefilum sp.]MDW7754469.1 oligosaccharide flippase family protein [Brevefilum sp.]
MKKPFSGIKNWGKDVVLKKVVGNSAYLFGSQAVSAVLSILTANLLGVASFGALGVVISFVTNINRLLSFRMADFVVRYMGGYLAGEKRENAAAVLKAAALTEFATSVLAYMVLVLLSGWGASNFAKDPSVRPLFLIYGIAILGNVMAESATGALQVTGHFKSQALLNLFESLLAAGLFLAVFLNQGGIFAVMLVYLAGKMVLGIGPVLLALYWLPKSLGKGWWRTPMRGNLPERKPMIRFALSSNFSSTVTILARDSEVLWVSYFFDTTVAGYFKVALAVINLVVMPITPFISTTFPEITKNVARKQWSHLKKLLTRVTVISASWTGAVAAGLLLLGRQLLFSPWTLFGRTIYIYKEIYAPAYSVLLVLLVGYGVANIFFWNRSLLLAFGQAEFPLKVSFLTMMGKVGLAFLIVPVLGYMAEAALFSAYFVVSVGVMVARGLGEIRAREMGGEKVE